MVARVRERMERMARGNDALWDWYENLTGADALAVLRGLAGT
jgi:hypothetical protein